MAADPLLPPPVILSSEAFAATPLSPASLVRISSYTTGEPYFNNSGLNRFDAPQPHPAYKTCYLGCTLAVAVAETVLHDEQPVDGRFSVMLSDLAVLHALRFEGDDLRLLPLTGALLKRLGGHADLAGTGNIALTHAWSSAVHANPARYDGILYMSRHLNDQKAVVLFDRAAPKIQLASHLPLLHDPGFPAAAAEFGIVT